jgi:(2Fe-2S) ferredoxin
MGKHDVVKVEKLARGARPCIGVCAGKHCARAGAKQVIHALRAALEEAGISEEIVLALTKCQDYCDEGPAITVMPGSYPYVDLTPEAARAIVGSHLCEGQPVVELLHRRTRRKLRRVG